MPGIGARSCGILGVLIGVFCSSLALTPRIVRGEELVQGDFHVTVDESGLLTAVLGPPIETVDGARFEFDGAIAEWFGISFDLPAGRVEGVGIGAVPDWDLGRTPVTPVSFTATTESATAVTAIEGLEVQTDLFFDGGDLILTVTLTNTTPAPIINILYSREWQAVPLDPIYWTFPYDLPGTGLAAVGVSRRFWMPDDLEPGASRSLTFSYRSPGSTTLSPGVDVPLSLWTSPSHPAGVNFGATNGISIGDYDADGWWDVFACMSGNLWRNIDGEDWEVAADLDSVLPFTQRRYGSSFGDYNEDGLPDIGTEPRRGWGGDECMHLLQNLGDATFEDIATDPALIGLQPCGADAETICWGDVDCDADLDCFLPVYPPWAFGSPGNFFLHNLGPTGPGDAYHFAEESAAAGLDNPPGSARSEGAQFVDVDADGDMDLYCNGTLYQNVSASDDPAFLAMTTLASGISLSSSLDEGIVFTDYDMDGDYDLTVVYTGPGVRIWDNYGDGTFHQMPITIVASPFTGLDLGVSAEDWDNDGDMDFTTRQVFRRNMLMETGEPGFVIASHTIPPSHITSATPAWGDWDRDGDLDCALGNWLSTGHFYENTLYDGSEPLAERRFLRVRVLRDSTAVVAGLETEYGADVELMIHGDDSGLRRRKFVSSSGGYLNQNEYTLHFALPPDPAPEDDTVDVVVDLLVNLPSLPSDGYRRLDRYVNPALGSIAIAELADREIVVYRSGAVVIDGVTHAPTGWEPALLTTAGGTLVQPGATTPLPAPTDLIDDSRVGLEFNTLGASERVRIREILIDGELAPATTCSGVTANVLVWDVTDPTAPFVVEGGAIDVPVHDFTRRSVIPCGVLLDIDRVYRLVGIVNSGRGTPITAPIVYPNLTVTGGLQFFDPTPCTGTEIASVPVDPEQFCATIRFGVATFVAETFQRGDCDRDGAVGIGDAISYLSATFSGMGQVRCADACDVNDDGGLDLADAIALLDYLFTGGPPPPAPFGACGADPTADDLDCALPSVCP